MCSPRRSPDERADRVDPRLTDSERFRARQAFQNRQRSGQMKVEYELSKAEAEERRREEAKRAKELREKERQRGKHERSARSVTACLTWSTRDDRDGRRCAPP